MKLLKRHRKLVIILVLAVVLFGVATALKGSKYRESLLGQPLIRHFTHTFFSLRKISDVLFIPYLFAKSDLPTYYTKINPDNIIRMNEVLTENNFSGTLEEENKLFVTAEFSSPEYADRVKIRYRGRGAVHWNSLKKSLRVKFPDENFLDGARLINFIIPYDRLYFVEPLHMYRAKKLGLIDLPMSFSRLNINGVDIGVYLTFEQWSPEFLTKKGLPESPLYRRVDETDIVRYTKEQYEDFLDEDGTGDKEEIVAFLELLLKADDKTFTLLIPEIFNMEKFYSWNILNIIAGSNHQDEANNTILYFNNVTGRFEIIPWDIHIGEIGLYDDTKSLLVRRILSIEKFRTIRDQKLREYLADDKGLEDDLAFYDALFEKNKKEFFRDTSKLHSNLKFLKTVKENRVLIEKNWGEAKKFLDSPPTYSFIPEADRPDFKGSFQNFSLLGDSRALFLAKNKAFYPIGGDSVGLSGSVILLDDTIIPSGIGLTITAGTEIFLGDGASLVLHGPLNALGTRDNPIKISRYNTRKPWGSLLVLNAERDKSRVSFLNVDGGSGDRINGIKITGMVAFHNSDVDIYNSTFTNAEDDDALNIKMASGSVKWSYFKSNSSDALDVDFLKDDFEIAENVFVESGGDAIDLSFSNIDINKNTIRICGDKGISVGEKSEPKISENSIEGCAIGIAVKDLSEAIIKSNTLRDNSVAISLYKKKEEFGGAHASLITNTFLDNEEDIKSGQYSSYDRYKK
jgi:parallel beta-helix repeat protein